MYLLNGHVSILIWISLKNSQYIPKNCVNSFHFLVCFWAQVLVYSTRTLQGNFTGTEVIL